MRTIVTGATGYLGRALAASLIADGRTVHALVRSTSNLERVRAVAPDVTFHVHDGTTESIATIIGDIDPEIVFHLAARYRREDSPSDLDVLVEANVLFGTQVLDAMRRAGCHRLVAAGSAFEHHGEGGDQALNLYAATKQAFGEILAYYAEVAAIDAVVTVLYDVYGPDDERRRLPTLMREAQFGGPPLSLPARPIKVDMLFVDDAVAALVRAGVLTAEQRPGVRRFAASGGSVRSISDVVAAFERASGRPVPVASDAYPVPDRSIETPWRGPQVPGWAPKVSLEDGFRLLLMGDESPRSV
ncbi:MAG: NAD(P)-dependent oxidoreductase [Acidimicrobiia bacterium]